MERLALQLSESESRALVDMANARLAAHGLCGVTITYVDLEWIVAYCETQTDLLRLLRDSAANMPAKVDRGLSLQCAERARVKVWEASDWSPWHASSLDPDEAPDGPLAASLRALSEYVQGMLSSITEEAHVEAQRLIDARHAKLRAARGLRGRLQIFG